MEIPNGDMIDCMFIASGAPTQKKFTKSDIGGKNGRIAQEISG